MKNLKIKLGLYSLLTAFVVLVFLVSCEQEKVANMSSDSQIQELENDKQSNLPKIIGQVDGFNIYESAEFLKQTDRYEEVQFPVLVKTPESEYQLTREDVNTGEVGLRGGTHGIRINNPYLQQAATHEDSEWSAPNHHRRWNGKWATDLWKSNGSGVDYAQSCNIGVFLNIQIYNWYSHFESVKGKVVKTALACSSGNVEHGGHMQEIKLYGKKNWTWHYLGRLVFAHLDEASLAYSDNDEFLIANYPYQGIVYLGNISPEFEIACSGGQPSGCCDKANGDCCSLSCHLHFEVESSSWSNYHVGSGNSNIGWSDKIWSFYKWF